VATLDCPDDGGINFLRNVDTDMKIHIVSQLRRLRSSSAPLRKLQILQAIPLSTEETKGLTNGRRDRHV